jgi:hypothetical protein
MWMAISMSRGGVDVSGYNNVLQTRSISLGHLFHPNIRQPFGIRPMYFIVRDSPTPQGSLLENGNCFWRAVDLCHGPIYARSHWLLQPKATL